MLMKNPLRRGILVLFLLSHVLAFEMTREATLIPIPFKIVRQGILNVLSLEVNHYPLKINSSQGGYATFYVKKPFEQAVINFNVSQPGHCGGIARFMGKMDEGITGLLGINTMDYLDPYRCSITPGKYTNYFTIYVDGEEDSIISFQV